MHAGHPHICLVKPEIPQNTGNIGRLAAATASRMHIVKPVPYSLDDKNLRRAGLDYWPYLDLEIHESFDDFLALGFRKLAFLSSNANARPYFEIPPDTDALIFGNETSGLEKRIWEEFADYFYFIPMYHPKVRSLNVANAVSIVLYDQLLKRGILDDRSR